MSESRHSDLGYLTLPDVGHGNPVLIIHSWWGLTTSFISMADDLSSRGFVVGCGDLYAGRIATTATEARSLRSTRRRVPAYKTLRHSLDLLRAHERSTGRDPVVIGFSMGGQWALWLAQHPDPPVSGVVVYYAARGGDFTQMKAPMIAQFAGSDEFVTGSARGNMERALHRQGIDYTAFDYPAAEHWFAEPAHPAFHPRSAELAMERSVAFVEVCTGV